MMIYIPTYNRADTISTHLLLEKAHLDYKIIVHSTDQLALYAQNDTIPPHRLLMSGMPLGLAQNRQWILNQLQEGEWCVMMDDNIKGWTALEEPWYQMDTVPVKEEKEYGKRFTQKIGASQLLAYIEQDIQKAEKIGSHLIGYSTTSNHYFRDKHYSTIGYVIGKMIVVKKSHLHYDFRLLSIDDHDWTAQNLLSFGCVLINRFIWPMAEHFGKGGLGVYEERLEKRLHDCRYLVHKYPGLFRYRLCHPGWHPKQDVALRFYDRKNIEKWRQSMLKTGVSV